MKIEFTTDELNLIKRALFEQHMKSGGKFNGNDYIELLGKIVRKQIKSESLEG